MAKLSKRLKTLRKEKELKKKDVAQFLHLSERTYSYYESDERTPPISTIEKLADYYGVSVDFLLGRTKNRQGSFADDLTKLQRDAFYEIYGELISDVIDATKKAVKAGTKQAHVDCVVYGIDDADDAKRALTAELTSMVRIGKVDVEVRDVGAPFGLMPVDVDISWNGYLATP